MKRPALFALAAAVLLQACASPDSARPDAAAMPGQWQTTPAAAGQATLERNWWAGFNDPVLTRLVEQALARNTDLRLAAARVAEARALSDAQRGAARPNVDFGLGAQRSRSLSATTGQPYRSSVAQPQFQASYELDLWGRVDALGQAADAQLKASQDARDSAALSVAATVATGYINLRALDARLVLARETLTSRDAALKLARSRQQQGYASSLETSQAEAEYRATAQVIPQLTLAIGRQEHALNLLLGEAPAPVERGTALQAFTAPALPDAGLPSELLRRRPDIASAEAQVAASDAQLAAARAQLLPSIHLSASLGAISSSALRGDPFTLWGLGASVLAPIFDGGRLKAQARASASRRDQALLGYQKTVLTAFAEVEDQLSALQQLQQQATQAEAQRQALQEALRVAHNRYREGYAAYLDELDAQRNLFNAEQTVLQLQADRLNAQISLYRALGGGWQPQG